MIKSINYNQSDLIKDILTLHVKKETFDMDPTFSSGKFYKHIPIPKYVSDIAPKFDFVEEADCRNLPVATESIHSIMFDPPFITGTGPSLDIDNPDNNKTARRFGLFPNEKELHQFYTESIAEFYRVLAPNGILVFKCQDKVSSGTQYFSHTFIINEAEKMGFYTKDLFVLLAKARMIPEWHTKNQKHARKFHSYFLVFEKSDKKVTYV